MILPYTIIEFKIGVEGTSTKRVIPLGTYTESFYLGIAYPPHVY